MSSVLTQTRFIELKIYYIHLWQSHSVQETKMVML